MSNHHEEMEAHYASGRHRQDAQHAAEIVCHQDQMTVWADEIVGRLAMGGYLRDDFSYDDKLAIHDAVADEVRSIIESAFGHPALASGR